MSLSAIKLVNLSKRFGKTLALNAVTLQVNEGDIFGLLGPNGAGKTTLLSIISTLLEPTSGQVRIWGRLLDRRDRDVRRSLGIVPQELAIYPELTGRENLAFFGELYHVRGAELATCVAETLAAVGLQDRADERASTYSGGMKRRLNLGAALVHRPTLLLLDEPTTGVDPQSRSHIFDEVRRLNAAGVTVVYTSHYMEEVQALCSRVGILDHGRLIACDTLANLLKQLPGLIRFRVAQLSPALRERIKDLADVRLLERDGRPIELECHDVKTTLVQVLSLLQELRVELTSLEMEEPNLERVFLHLTGRALRD
jgi:ABC-2 type transport system ATP-binding protein